MYKTSGFYLYWLSGKLRWTKIASTTLKLGTFSPFLAFSINFVISNNFLVSGIFNPSLYLSFTLDTLPLRIGIRIGTISNKIVDIFKIVGQIPQLVRKRIQKINYDTILHYISLSLDPLHFPKF